MPNSNLRKELLNNTSSERLDPTKMIKMVGVVVVVVVVVVVGVVVVVVVVVVVMVAVVVVGGGWLVGFTSSPRLLFGPGGLSATVGTEA